MIVHSNRNRSAHRVLSNPYDQVIFSRIIAQKEPFLRRVNSIASFVLDDHPYPKTSAEFHRRTQEINKGIRDLHLSSSDQKFLDRLMLETGVSVVDLWQGSHVIVRDEGRLYNLWSKSRKARPRFSSHYRNVPVRQYGMSFKHHQLLFGKTSLNGSTWFQMEAHAFNPNDIFGEPNLVLYHGQDFLKYRYHGMNVGPFGFSPHTETARPIQLQYRPLNLQSSTQILSLPFRTRLK